MASGVAPEPARSGRTARPYRRRRPPRPCGGPHYQAASTETVVVPQERPCRARRLTCTHWKEHHVQDSHRACFSQQDLPYVEPVAKGHHLSALSAFRRGEIADFQKEAPYPPRFRVDPAWVHRLPVPNAPITYSLDSMLGRRGVYQYDFDENALLAVGKQPSDEDLAPTIQGQNWIGGGGVSVFVIVQWDRYQWLYRHSRAYLNLLIQIGEFAQELLQAAYQLGLVGWLTPAVSESRAALPRPRFRTAGARGGGAHRQPGRADP